MSCHDVIGDLTRYLDAELKLARRVDCEAHLAGCRACLVYFRAYRVTIRLAREAWVNPAAADAIPEPLVRAIVVAGSRLTDAVPSSGRRAAEG
jgi:anti-sigma factor RsiW